MHPVEWMTLGQSVEQAMVEAKPTAEAFKPLAGSQTSANLDERSVALGKMIDDNDKRTVLVTMTIYRFSSLDMPNQRFDAEINVHLYWYEPAMCATDQIKRLEDKYPQPVKLIDDEDCDPYDETKLPIYVPRITFENAVRTEEVAKALDMRSKWPSGIVHWEQRSRCTFTEIFELENFPYDLQVHTFGRFNPP